MKFDVDRIIADADTQFIAESIGMSIYKTGNSTYVECVSGEHRETKYNHNQLKNDGCYCYTCGKSYGKIAMVQKFYENILGLPISFSKACMITADTCGGYKKYLIKGKYKDDDFPLTKAQIEAIGLSPKPASMTNRIIASVSPCKTNGYTSYKGEYVKFKVVQNNSLQNLWNEDKSLFKQLVLAKAKETMDTASDIIAAFSVEPISEFGAYTIIEYQHKYNAAKEIYIAFGGRTHQKPA